MHRINGLDPYEQAVIEETVGNGAELLVEIIRKTVELAAPEHRDAVGAAILATAAQRLDGITTAFEAKATGMSGRLMAVVSRWKT